MFEYRFANPEDMPHVIDFIDLVFSQLRVPHDFEKLIPKVYGPGKEFSSIHAIALDGNNVRGCVAVLPYPLKVAGETLKVGYLGSVSVHRNDRGAGHMRKLMEMQIEKAKADGLDMVLLGGQRQRYAYYGFVPTGSCYVYGISAANVRHALKDTDASGLTFEVLTQSDAAYAFALYQQQAVCGARTEENFIDAALSFNGCAWLIRHNGVSAGYLVAGTEAGEIRELAVEDTAILPAVIKGWLTDRGMRRFSVSVPVQDAALNRFLAQIAESISQEQGTMMLCLNPAKVIRAWMKLKNSMHPLSEGSVKLAVDGQVLCISVANGEVCVEPCSGPADAALSMMDAVHLLFSFNRYCAPEINCAIPADWFPLPLYVPTPDHF